MGKDLKGKEIGEEISQRKDSKYTARFTNRLAKRVEKHFDIVSEAKNGYLKPGMRMNTTILVMLLK